jgi:hypothetical protein
MNMITFLSVLITVHMVCYTAQQEDPLASDNFSTLQQDNALEKLERILRDKTYEEKVTFLQNLMRYLRGELAYRTGEERKKTLALVVLCKRYSEKLKAEFSSALVA